MIKLRKIIPLITLLAFFSLLAVFVYRWVDLARPPLKSMGETRLLYAFLLLGTGLFLYRKLQKALWPLFFALTMALVFVVLNLLHPELMDKTLMPALQSPWFVPHVVAYIQGYALLAFATFFSFAPFLHRLPGLEFMSEYDFAISDQLIIWGLALVTLGMLMGAYWAKIAWGHYWSFDPKETWALISWLLYIIYIHFRRYYPKSLNWARFLLVFNFIFILICWMGVNYLPSAARSVHVYAS